MVQSLASSSDHGMVQSLASSSDHGMVQSAALSSDQSVERSVPSSLDHGVVRQLQLSLAPLQRARDAVAHLEVGVADVGGQHHPEVRGGHLVALEAASDDRRAVALVLHLGLGRVLAAAGDLDDLAGGAAPPGLLQQPVGDEGRLGPAFVGEEEHAGRVAVVAEHLAAALAAGLVVEQLHHPRHLPTQRGPLLYSTIPIAICFRFLILHFLEQASVVLCA